MSWTGGALTLYGPIGTMDRVWPAWPLQLGKSEMIREFFNGLEYSLNMRNGKL